MDYVLGISSRRKVPFFPRCLSGYSAPRNHLAQRCISNLRAASALQNRISHLRNTVPKDGSFICTTLWRPGPRDRTEFLYHSE